MYFLTLCQHVQVGADRLDRFGAQALSRFPQDFVSNGKIKEFSPTSRLRLFRGVKFQVMSAMVLTLARDSDWTELVRLA